MVEKELILVRCISDDQIKELVNDLILSHINYRYRQNERKILTKNVSIKCVTIPIGSDQCKCVRGLRAVGCFGFDDKSTDYITKGNNICKGYKLMDYIRDMEEMGY